MAGHSLLVLSPREGDVSVGTAALPKPPLWWLGHCHWLWGVAGGNNGTNLHLRASAVSTGGQKHSPSAGVLWGNGKGSLRACSLGHRSCSPNQGVTGNLCVSTWSSCSSLNLAGTGPSLLSLIFPLCCWSPGGNWDVLCWTGARLSWLFAHEGCFHVSVRHGLDPGWPDGKGTALF